MDTETAANPADDGPVTLVDAVEAASNQASSEEAQAPAGESEGTLDDLAKEALGETEATPEDEIEVEYDGDKRKLPPKWRDAFLRTQDYTRKTMDLAEQRKSLETERETFKSTASQIAQNYQDHLQLAVIHQQIQELETLDVTGWSQDQINAEAARLNGMKAHAAQFGADLQQRTEQASKAQSEQIAKQREDCFREVAAKVPNFTDTRRQELEAFAVKHGADPKEVAMTTMPGVYELLHYADIGSKFIERQRKAGQMKAAHAGTPVTMLGSAASGGKSPDDMTMEEYAAWRSAGNG